MIRTAWSFLVRDFLVTVSYRAAFALQLIGMLFSIAVFFYMGVAVGETTAGSIQHYGGSYFAFLIIGTAFADYLQNSFQTFSTSIREGQMIGTLEMLLASPLRPSVIILSSSLWSYLYASLRIGIILALAVLLFDLDLGRANWTAATCVLALSIAYLMGLGIMMAGLVLVMKQERVVTSVIVFSSVLLGGVAFPVDVLPSWLRFVAELLPFTHSVTGLRRSLLLGESWSDLAPVLLTLLAFAVVLFPLGLATFNLCLNRVKVTGTLGHY